MANWTVEPTYPTQDALRASLKGLHPDAFHIMVVAGGLVKVWDKDFPKITNLDNSDVDWQFAPHPNNADLTGGNGLAGMTNPHHAKVFHGPGGFGVLFVAAGTVSFQGVHVTLG